MALDEPWARPLVNRGRRNGWLQVIGGLLLFILVGVGANVFAGNSDQLRETGGRTAGSVVQLRGFQVTADTSALVRYTVNGRDYAEKVDLGNRIRNYHAGQQVTVYYDPERPSTMTIDDINNAPTWTVLPMAIAFVAGLGFMVYGAINLVFTRRKRRLLASVPWREDAKVLGARGTGLYLALPDGSLVRAFRSAKAPPPDLAAPVRVVIQDKRTLAVLGDPPTELLSARPPRTHQEEQTWRRLLEQPTEP
jgi:hypothetical protein